MATIDQAVIISSAIKHEPCLPDARSLPPRWKHLLEGCWAPVSKRLSIEKVLSAIQLIFSFVEEGSETLSSSEKLIVNRQEITRRNTMGEGSPPSTREMRQVQIGSNKRLSSSSPDNNILLNPDKRNRKLQETITKYQMENSALKAKLAKQQKVLEEQAKQIISACEASLAVFKETVDSTLRESDF